MELTGERVRLRTATVDDVDRLVEIRSTPEVLATWRGGDLEAETIETVTDDDDVDAFVIEFDGRVVGLVQCSEEDDEEYRHAGIDIYLDPAVHGRGIGTDAVRTLAAHLIDDRGHHRLTIDPAADNAAAIACYSKVGFKPVGVMRQYESGGDGTWHDGLLMDLLADELVR